MLVRRFSFSLAATRGFRYHSGMTIDLKSCLYNSAFAFRGYNVTNLGRTPELLEVPAYAPLLTRFLEAASEVCSEFSHHEVDLVARVRKKEETTLDSYDEAVALIVAVEQAQIAILREQFSIDLGEAKFAFGYSLGEISALISAGVFDMNDALRVPLAMAADAVELAHEVTLGVFFSAWEGAPVGRGSTALRQNQCRRERGDWHFDHPLAQLAFVIGTGRYVGSFSGTDERRVYRANVSSSKRKPLAPRCTRRLFGKKT